MVTHYIELLRRFWTVVVGAALAAGALACGISLALLETMPLYKSSVTVNIQPSEEALRFNSAFRGISQFNPADIITQAHIETLVSRPVAERAVDILRSEGAPAASADPPSALDRVKTALRRQWALLNYGYFAPVGAEEQAIADLREATDIRAVAGSYILEIEVTHESPDLAARAANALARAYVEVSREDGAAEARKVDHALAALQTEKEAALARYRERRRALDREIGFDSVEAGRALLLASRNQARQALSAGERKLASLRARLDHKGENEAAPAALRSELVSFKTLAADQKAALSHAEAGLLALDRIESELAEIDLRIREAEGDLTDLQSRRVAAQLARRADLDRVHVIDAAAPPRYPAFPKVLVNTVVGTVLGAILALAPIAAMDVLGDRIRTAEDLRDAVGGRALPTVSRGLVARARRFLRRGRSPGRALETYADAIGLRLLSEGGRTDGRIHVTALGAVDDAERLRRVVEASMRILAPRAAEGGAPPQVVALPPLSRLPNPWELGGGPILIAVPAGGAERAEVARLAAAAPAGAAAPLFAVMA